MSSSLQGFEGGQVLALSGENTACQVVRAHLELTLHGGAAGHAEQHQAAVLIEHVQEGQRHEKCEANSEVGTGHGSALGSKVHASNLWDCRDQSVKSFALHL